MVHGVAPGHIQHLLHTLGVDAEKPIGEAWQTLYLNFATLDLAQDAVLRLHGHPSPTDPGTLVSAALQNPTEQLVQQSRPYGLGPVSTAHVPELSPHSPAFVPGSNPHSPAFVPGKSTQNVQATQQSQQVQTTQIGQHTQHTPPPLPAHTAQSLQDAQSSQLSQPTPVKSPAQPVQPAQSVCDAAPDNVMMIETGRLPESQLHSLLVSWGDRPDVLHVSLNPPHLHVCFATSQQAAAAVQQCNSSALKDARNGTAQLFWAALQSSRDAKAASQKPYIAPKPSAIDAAKFRSAGLLLARKTPDGKSEVLLRTKSAKLALLSDLRRTGESAELTAIRVLNAAVLHQLPAVFNVQPQSLDHSFAVDLVSQAQVIWLGLAAAPLQALFIADVDRALARLPAHVQKQVAPSASLSANLQNKVGWRHSATAAQQQPLQDLAWVLLDSQSLLAVPNTQLSSSLAQVVAHCSPLQHWAASLVCSGLRAKLRADIQAAQQQSIQERQAVGRQVAQLSVLTPPVQDPQLPRDLVPVQPGSLEFQALQALFSDRVHSVKRVDVPARQARFQAWQRTLKDHKQISTVSILAS